MKKVLLTILTAAVLAGCSNDSVIEMGGNDAITFDNAFIDNSTRAAIDNSYTTSTLKEFQVYATITNTDGASANIFNGEKVVKGNSLGQGVNWSYNVGNTQYWIPGNSYSFCAIADGNVAGVTEVVAAASDKFMASAINLLDASAQKDILLAQESVTNYESGAKTVAFTFSHLMSKVKFTFKNTITTNNGYGYKVSNIQIQDIAKNGVYTIGESEPWGAAATPETYDLSFGNATKYSTEGAAADEIEFGGSMESNMERLLIPSNKARVITFTTDLLKDGVVIDTQDRTINAVAIKLVPGSSYNFVVSLGNPGEPIQFDVTQVRTWVETTDNAIN